MTQNFPSSRCSKRNGQRGTDDCPLLVQPPSAGFDFTGIGLGMQPSLAPLFAFEMLDRIGDIDLRPVDSRLAERSVEDLTRRTNDRLSCQIFPVAGMLTNKSHLRLKRHLPPPHLGRNLGVLDSCDAGRGNAPRAR